MGSSDRRASLVAKQLAVQFQSDQKHVEDDAELRDDIEKRRNRGGKNKRRKLRGETAGERWPQQDAAEDLADDPWLADSAKQCSDEPAGDHNGRERDEYVQDCAGRAGATDGSRHRFCRRRRGQRLAVASDEKKCGDAADEHGGIGGNRREPKPLWRR